MKFPSTRRGKVIFGFFLILFFLCSYFFQREIKNFFYRISEPVQKVLWQVGKKTSDFFETVFGVGGLKEENEELKKEIQELLSKIAFLQELKKENEFLRDSLGLELEKDFDLIIAQVSQREIYQDTILINKGEKDCISKGWPVITSQKILIGKVSEIFSNFSRVVLTFSAGSSVNVKIANKDTSGIARGVGDSKVILDLIPKESKIEKGDLIITDPSDGIIPKGLLVGRIGEIKISDIKPFQEAEIDILFELKNLDDVFVIADF